MPRGTTRDTTSTTRYSEAEQVTTSGPTRYYEVPRVVVQVTTKNCEWYYEVLRSTTSCSASHCVVLREVSGTASNFLDAFSQRSSFKKIVMNNFTKFVENQLSNCDRVLALVKLQSHADNFTEKVLHRECFPMILYNCELWCIANCHEEIER